MFPFVIVVNGTCAFNVGLYNRYVELVGGAIGQGACAAVRRGNRIYVIEDDLPLIHFLSDSEVNPLKDFG